MPGLLRRFADWQHLIVAVLVSWLIVTSPWIAMLGRLPREPGPLDYAHVGLGLGLLPLAVLYSIACLRNGRWRLYFPWLAGEFGTMLADVRGLLRGRVPSAEGGGLFAALEGFVLFALLATAATGGAWWWTAGTSEALDWRSHHIVAARMLIVLVVAHAASVSLHVLEFVKD